MGYPGASTVTVVSSSGEYDRGNWDANANNPVLADNGVGGVVGDYYTVSVAGATLIDGENNWDVGDIIKNVDSVTGKKWVKRDQAVTIEDIGDWYSQRQASALDTLIGGTAIVGGPSTVPLYITDLTLTGLVVGKVYDLEWQVEVMTQAGYPGSYGIFEIRLSKDADDYLTDLAANDLVDPSQRRIGSGNTQSPYSPAFGGQKPGSLGGTYRFTALATSQAISLLGNTISQNTLPRIRNFSIHAFRAAS